MAKFLDSLIKGAIGFATGGPVGAAIGFGSTLFAASQKSGAERAQGNAAQAQGDAQADAGLATAEFQAQAAQSAADAQARALRQDAAEVQAAGAAADYNAAIAGNNAILAVQLAAEKEQRYRINAAKQNSLQKVSMGAGGIELTGSASIALAESAANAELNALTIRHAGVVESQSFLNAQSMDQYQSRVAASQASFILQQAEYVAAGGPQAAAAIRAGAGSTAAGLRAQGSAAASAGRSASASTLIGSIPALFDYGTKIAKGLNAQEARRSSPDSPGYFAENEAEYNMTVGRGWSE